MNLRIARDAAKGTIIGLLTRLQHFRTLSKKLDSFCVRYHKVHINFNYDHQTNGERWILERLADENLFNLAFDVGANHGDWTTLALEINPHGKVHCFEICPPTFQKLHNRLSSDRRVVLNPFGLSDSTGDLDLKYCPDGDGLSSLIEVVCSSNTRTMKVQVNPGKEYCSERKIGKIDFLKLDVEGAEHLVLKGFDDTLTPVCVPVVQFEYGMVNIASRYLLRDFYDYFTNRGYQVGKLFPKSVRFREYRFEDEDFLGPNYIAASPEIAALLSKARA